MRIVLLFACLLASGCVGYRNQALPLAQRTQPPAPRLLGPELWPRFRAERRWASPEEAIQFVAWLHEQGLLADDATVVPELLAQVAQEATGLFPIRACTAARAAGGVIHLAFAGAQNVSIPGSWGQAALAISPELALALDRAPGDPDGYRTWRFTVVGGGMRLNSSWLLKWIVNEPLADRDLQVHRLGYHEQDPGEHRKEPEVLVSAAEERLIPGKFLQIERHGERQVINILAPGFPRLEDLVVESGRIHAAAIDEEWELRDEATMAGWRTELAALEGQPDRELGAHPDFEARLAQPSWRRAHLQQDLDQADENRASWAPFLAELAAAPAAVLQRGLRYRLLAIYDPLDEWGDLAPFLWPEGQAQPPSGNEALLRALVEDLPVVPWGASPEEAAAAGTAPAPATSTP
jgi:hypothetical protein